MRDADLRFGNDVRRTERAVAVAGQDDGITAVQGDCHHQVLYAVTVEIAYIHIRPVPAKGVLGDQLESGPLHERAVTDAVQKEEASLRTRDCQVLDAIAVEIPDGNFCHPGPDVHLTGLEGTVPIAKHDREVVWDHAGRSKTGEGVCDEQIQPGVVVHICGDNYRRIKAGRVGEVHRRIEGAVAVSRQQRETDLGGVNGDGQVLLSVTVKISGGEVLRLTPSGIIHPGSERAVGIAQHDCRSVCSRAC